MSRAYQIPDFPNYYITDTGDVYSRNYNRTGRFKKLSPHKISIGYILVALHKRGVVCYKYVHRLVAEAFIPNPENKPQVNHINGVRNDNRVENLEWVTESENALHSFQKLGRRGCWSVEFNRVHPKSKPVLQFKDGKFVAEFKSTGAASRATGAPQGSICACCNKKRLSAGGFQWKYK